MADWTLMTLQLRGKVRRFARPEPPAQGSSVPEPALD